jgi:uridine phosphorylase
MALPRFDGKTHLFATYTPAVFLDALRGGGWDPGVVPETVLYTYARFELYLATQTDTFTPNHMLGTGPGRFFLVDATDGRVGINCLGTGPSATAAQLELQATLGVRRAIIVGSAGGLHPDQRPGDIVVPSEAVRADGTSDHYAADDVPALPDAELTRQLDDFLHARGFATTAAPCWTTAAPFRTTAEEVRFYADQGVRAVEEEAAALFVVAAAREVQAAAALVIDGRPTAGGWHVELPTAQQQLQRVFAATVDFAAGLEVL